MRQVVGPREKTVECLAQEFPGLWAALAGEAETEARVEFKAAANFYHLTSAARAGGRK